MKITCKATTWERSDQNNMDTVHLNIVDYTFGGYGLELGNKHLVMGVVSYKDSNTIYYLIDTYGKPFWFPSQLFEILDHSVPQNWFINVYCGNETSNVNTLLGFDELVKDEDFHDQLIERDEEVLRLYFKRKIELEQSC
ncbi:hypothetical protein DYBT9623_01607 [Dyadobacter sp. CECT 9623]|uniref:Uncharacterized protein n=1 Tax=Dyadobacter linearis TaxID=2823330 RepID=A0ABN7R3Z0_9BACT|nr:hypothetical protein [Dyadobacter sp. CECT 9623]CAG5068875.1 hypothetical protein DYBT9623_01607 [Dyadobacter sp. CECT 9623]